MTTHERRDTRSNHYQLNSEFGRYWAHVIVLHGTVQIRSQNKGDPDDGDESGADYEQGT